MREITCGARRDPRPDLPAAPGNNGLLPAASLTKGIVGRLAQPDWRSARDSVDAPAAALRRPPMRQTDDRLLATGGLGRRKHTPRTDSPGQAQAPKRQPSELCQLRLGVSVLRLSHPTEQSSASRAELPDPTRASHYALPAEAAGPLFEQFL